MVSFGVAILQNREAASISLWLMRRLFFTCNAATFE